MKIALCFYGQSRNIDKSYENIYNNIIKDNNVDIFIHTWKNNLYDRAIKFYDPISYTISTDMNFDYRKKTNDPHINVYPQLYSISKVRQLKIDHELEYDIKYDIVIKMRMDLVLYNKIDFINIDSSKINVCSNKHPHHRWFDDNFSISNSYLFDRFYNMFDVADEYFTEENKIKYNQPHPGYFGEGAHLFFSDYYDVYAKINKIDNLNFEIVR